MNDSQLKYQLMPSTVIIKNFVSGINYCNYELFLLELLNNSKFFPAKGGSLFCKPESEESGQNDAISLNYELDFKLFLSQTILRSKSLLEKRPINLSNGITLYAECKKPSNKITVTRHHVALRKLSLEELENIPTSKSNKTDIDNDISGILSIIKTEKNILLFLPYMFSFENQLSLNNAVKIIESALNDDFKNLFLYRERKVSGFDTFLTTEYNNEFLLFQTKSGKLTFIESVHTEKTPPYQQLLGLADMRE